MTHWIYPANIKFYDVLAAFSQKTAYWPIKSKIAKQDKVLIYLAAPYKQIGFVCQVAQIGLRQDEVYDKVSPFFKQVPDAKGDLKPFMKLNKIQSIPLTVESPLRLNQLRQAGLKGMLMSPRNLDNSPMLLNYIKENI